MQPDQQSQPKISPHIKDIEEKAFLEETIDIYEVYKSKLKELAVQEKAEILGFRKKWSNNLLWLVVAIVVFNGTFLILIGRDVLLYKDEWLVRIIFAGSFVEVLGLARIVVQFLFKDAEKGS